MFITASLIIAEKQKQAKSPSNDKQNMVHAQIGLFGHEKE